MHEIITLQLGQRSAYLATHFWNAQESYFTYSADEDSVVDDDIHFRPGIGADGTETFTPRTLIYDLKGGFGSLKRINALYEIEEPTIPQGVWNGPTIVQRQALIQQNAYQQSLESGLDPAELTTESVKYWSDFNRVYFHPKSIVQLNEFELGSKLQPFENWNVGEELFASLDKEHDLLDRDLRNFAEEADHMQGIQIMASVDDAWGGFAARYLDRIRDEYGKTTVLVCGLEDSLKSLPRERRAVRLSNTARSLSEITPQASLFVPITLPSARLPAYVSINPASQWHVSALLSTAVETLTLPSRLKLQDSNRETVDQLVRALNINGNQNIAKLRMSIDQSSALNGSQRPGRLDVREQSRDTRMPSRDGRANNDEDNTRPEILDMDFFPTETGEQVRSHHTIKKLIVFGQTESHRGKDSTNADADTQDQGFERARRRAAGLPIIHTTKTSLPFPLLDSFPKIYAQTEATLSVGVSTSLTTDTSVASRIKDLQRVVNRVVEVDEREALSNSLGEIAEAYEEGYDSGSDDDEDE